MINFTSIIRREDGLWTFTWADTGAAYYRVVLYGIEMEAAWTELTYTYPLPGWETSPPPLEIAEEAELVDSEVNLPYLIPQWYYVDGAVWYEVLENVSSVWTQKYILDQAEVWVFSFQTPNLLDETLSQWRVKAYDLVENASTELNYQVFIVRPPPVPTVNIRYSNPHVVVETV